MKYLKRAIALPFWMGFVTVHLIFLWVKFNLNFILYGGEAVAYESKSTPKKIAEVYSIVEEQLSVMKDMRGNKIDKK